MRVRDWEIALVVSGAAAALVWGVIAVAVWSHLPTLFPPWGDPGGPIGRAAVAVVLAPLLLFAAVAGVIPFASDVVAGFLWTFAGAVVGALPVLYWRVREG